jgi:hypothetical protein
MGVDPPTTGGSADKEQPSFAGPKWTFWVNKLRAAFEWFAIHSAKWHLPEEAFYQVPQSKQKRPHAKHCHFFWKMAHRATQVFNWQQAVRSIQRESMGHLGADHHRGPVFFPFIRQWSPKLAGCVPDANKRDLFLPKYFIQRELIGPPE